MTTTETTDWRCYRGHPKNIVGTKKRQCLWCRHIQQNHYWFWTGEPRRRRARTAHRREVYTAMLASIKNTMPDLYEQLTKDEPAG